MVCKVLVSRNQLFSGLKIFVFEWCLVFSKIFVYQSDYFLGLKTEFFFGVFPLDFSRFFLVCFSSLFLAQIFEKFW